MKHLLLAALFLLVPVARAQDDPTPAPAPAPAPETPAPTPGPAAEPAKPAANGNGRGGAAAATPTCTANTPRAYERVILPDTKTQEGIFKVHHVNTCYYYEIPVAELGKDFLLVGELARNTIGAGYGGRLVGDLVVRWERRENRIFLRNINYDIIADPKSEIFKAVTAANTPAILMAFNIEAFGKEEAPVIEVSRLFTTDVPEMSGRNTVRGRGMDAQRSFIDKITAFPTNIEAEATQTFTNPVDGGIGGGGGRGGQQVMQPGSGTVTMHFSMVKLPENPMVPRLADSRVGYFSTSTMDFSRPEHRAERRTFIARWRLEKKDPTAALSEPVKPIVYYVDPATPKAWVPFIKKGIESWQPAFEAAGFKNAIIAKEAPSAEEDPNWSPEDARYSVIRWLPSTTENASGPHISDPRTGEILDADVQFYHNVMNLARDWYFVQAGPLDPRAKKLPLPDALMGELIQFVAAHEIGHTLGLQHNMKASANYPAEKLRDAKWLAEMGHTPTIMDYARFNYVVQPEDHIDPKLLIPGIGPYDKFAIHWGYAPLKDVKNSDDEQKMLDEWAREQDKTPWLRFSTAGSDGADPGENTEAVGDSNAVWSTGLGLKNLGRAMDMLLTATTHDGEDWSDLEQVYGRALGQWSTELNHVTAIVGGSDSQDKHAGQDGVRFVSVPKARQQAAVKFLNANAFQTPAMFVKPELLRRMEPAGALTRIRTAQLRVLTSLMSAPRFNRLVEQETIDGPKAYKPTEFLADVRQGIFGEMTQAHVKIDAFRRNLQRAYLDLIASRLNGTNRATDDQRPMLRGELQAISNNARTASARAVDRETRLHLADLRAEIAKLLDPRYQQANPPQGNPLAQPVSLDDEFCWTDYAVVK
ncbi:MAG: zinc-dependent metalloprotease [Acidobacteriota bacterium]